MSASRDDKTSICSNKRLASWKVKPRSVNACSVTTSTLVLFLFTYGFCPSVTYSHGSRTRSRIICLSNILWRKMKNPSQPSFTQNKYPVTVTMTVTVAVTQLPSPVCVSLVFSAHTTVQSCFSQSLYSSFRYSLFTGHRLRFLRTTHYHHGVYTITVQTSWPRDHLDCLSQNWMSK